MCWITGGHTIHSPIEGLLLATGVEPTLFRKSAPKVAGLQVHATTPTNKKTPLKPSGRKAISTLFGISVKQLHDRESL